VRNQSKVHLLVMCQGFITHQSLLVVRSFVTIIMGVFQMSRLNNLDSCSRNNLSNSYGVKHCENLQKTWVCCVLVMGSTKLQELNL
jgi:hypothetical protein